MGQLLVCMVFTSLISLEIIKLLFRVAVPFYVPHKQCMSDPVFCIF